MMEACPHAPSLPHGLGAKRLVEYNIYNSDLNIKRFDDICIQMEQFGLNCTDNTSASEFCGDLIKRNQLHPRSYIHPYERRINKLQKSSSHWYYIAVRHVGRCSPEKTLQYLRNYTGCKSFTVYWYLTKKNGESSFITDNYIIAQKLFRKWIKTKDGLKLQTKTRSFNARKYVSPTTHALSVIMDIMINRYDAELESLNLGKFHSDPLFLANNLFYPLNMQSTVKIIIDYWDPITTSLKVLDLSDNYLSDIQQVLPIMKAFHAVKHLNIGNNVIEDLKELEVLQDLGLDGITLKGNPFCKQFRSEEDYIRGICELLPNIASLDGTDIVNYTVQDDEDKAMMPSLKDSFFGKEEGSIFIRQFLETYFTKYDSDMTRNELKPMYIDYGELSCQFYGPSIASGEQFSNRKKVFKQGNSNIINALNRLPRTKHNIATFKTDLMHFDTRCAQLNICGIYSEGSNNMNIQYFNRVFFFKKINDNYLITVDNLTVLPPSAEQIKKYCLVCDDEMIVTSTEFSNNIANVSNCSTMENLISSGSENEMQSYLMKEEEFSLKDLMKTRLSNCTGMNDFWSEKCLTELNWDYNEALAAFKRLRLVIPPEAFYN